MVLYSHCRGGFTDTSAYIEDPEKPLSPQEIKDHLLAFYQQQIGMPVTLVGASLGGMLAIDFANDFPEVCSVVT
jgi:pimeloyl-ACP methyl ester carboxylesterase